MDVVMGLLGCGTVGAGVVELTRRRAERIEEMTGTRPVIKKILVRDTTKPRGVRLHGEVLTDRPEDVLDDPTVGLVIETIGGIEPARSFILRAIAAGKHVVTANKDLMALHGEEILDAAESAHVEVFYEAAVGGAIPLIRPLKGCLTSNEITDLKGIINGTTNYIVSKMTETGADFEAVLAEAQALGYAESDPTSDVDGLDAARKLTILASIAFHTRVNLADVSVRGIRSITAADVAYAKELNCVIKLLAVGRERDGVLQLEVRPSLVPLAHPLAAVSDAFNALFVRGDAAGDLMFFGRGAGCMPTASAVVGDVIEVLQNMRMGISETVGATRLPRKVVATNQGPEGRYYIRLTAKDRPGVFAQVAGVFGDAGVSMESVLQRRLADQDAQIVVVTHSVRQAELTAAADRLALLEAVAAVDNVLPVEEMDADGPVMDDIMDDLAAPTASLS
ncbi:homoserine dehydrogenase [Alicyclobacillus sp. ALC3]|uniref:homoserine dehydrogenase n=1 Tax=Alicyclobacillus sp. ALC3 TaxID=2796143 RepID=UPI00237829A8|nr:homoserine dehydrogenase [Alicyclobacillus sp. ALC3]WDL95562.1 homoserine dehydrogenase [Alicyclobacillus sp. ALC3]